MRRAQQLGRYHLLDRIAFGGMAEIYRAKTFDAQGQPHLVAVKRVLAHLAEDDDFIQMLVDEAKIASVLRHGNIARVYEFARAHGEYFIAMEHVDGKDMRTVLERCRTKKKPIPPEHAAYICAEVGAALHAAHSAVDSRGRPLRIIHRDVSPSNIICSYAGEVKLCDFGIAKATLSRVTTKTGVIKGKVKYMSPEQALGRKLDHRSDVFSLGSVPLRDADADPAVHRDERDGPADQGPRREVPPGRELQPGMPPELEAICRQVPDAQPREPLPDGRRGRGRSARVPAQVHAELLAQPPRPVHPQDVRDRDRARAAHARRVRDDRRAVRRRRREPDDRATRTSSRPRCRSSPSRRRSRSPRCANDFSSDSNFTTMPKVERRGRSATSDETSTARTRMILQDGRGRSAAASAAQRAAESPTSAVGRTS